MVKIKTNIKVDNIIVKINTSAMEEDDYINLTKNMFINPVITNISNETKDNNNTNDELNKVGGINNNTGNNTDNPIGKVNNIIEISPCITFDVKYNKSFLQILPYNDLIKFFFNKSFFIFKINSMIYKFKINTSASHSEAAKKKIGTSNIITMLELLFPTKYPVISNNYASFNKYIQPTINVDTNRLQKAITDMTKIKLREYSYLKINGTEYTITQSIWCNDLINNIDYNKLYSEYISYDGWINEQNVEIDKTITNKINDFQIIYKKLFTNDASFNILLENLKTNINEMITDLSTNTILGSTSTQQIQLDKQTQTKFLESMNTEIDNQINPFSDSDPIYKYNYFKNITYYYDSYNKNNIFKIGFNKDSQKLIINIKKIIEKLEIVVIISKIKNDHFNTTSKINVLFQIEPDNSESSKTEILDNETILEKKTVVYLIKNYPKYVNYINLLKKYIQNDKVKYIISSNKELQDLIDNYAKGGDDKNPCFKDIMEDMNEVLTSKRRKINGDYIKYYDVGYSMLSLEEVGVPHYEIYVMLNVLKGVYNKNNISAIDCQYKSEDLGSRLLDVITKTTSYNAKSDRLYSVINDKKNVHNKQINNNQPNKTKPVYTKPTNPQRNPTNPQRNPTNQTKPAYNKKLNDVRLGGNKTKKKYRKYSSKTRKHI
jgi:hypothetical protein